MIFLIKGDIDVDAVSFVGDIETLDIVTFKVKELKDTIFRYNGHRDGI